MPKPLARPHELAVTFATPNSPSSSNSSSHVSKKPFRVPLTPYPKSSEAGDLHSAPSNSPRSPPYSSNSRSPLLKPKILIPCYDCPTEYAAALISCVQTAAIAFFKAFQMHLPRWIQDVLEKRLKKQGSGEEQRQGTCYRDGEKYEGA